MLSGIEERLARAAAHDCRNLPLTDPLTVHCLPSALLACVCVPAGFDWTLTGAAAASDISSVSGRSSAPTEQQHTNMSSPDIQQLHSHAPLSEDDDDNDDATTQQLDPHSYPHADMSLDTDSLSDLSSDALLQAASSSSTWSR